jgi:hypothetical protein
MTLYLLMYLVAGAVFAALMAVIQNRQARGFGSTDRTVAAVYLMIGLAWPVAAAALCHGLLSHLFSRTASGDRAS